MNKEKVYLIQNLLSITRFTRIFIVVYFIFSALSVCTGNIEAETVKTGGEAVNSVSPVKSLIIVYSYHHKNTEKIAQVFAEALSSQIKTPQQADPQELKDYALIGFGSGIYSAKHHESVLGLVDKLPQGEGQKVFIFSTFGAPAFLLDEKEFNNMVDKNHSALREKLRSKGYVVVDEFSCVGFNMNSFLKFFGGLNKGRPDAEDLKHAEEFAIKLKQIISR